MSIERNESFARNFQDMMLAHILRHPQLLQLAVRGKFKELDFDLPIHRVVLLAALDIIRVRGGNTSYGIAKMEELMPKLQESMRVGAIKPDEVSALCKLIAEMYSVTLSPDYYYGMTEAFLNHQRVHAELKEVSASNIGSLYSKLSRVALDSKITVHEPIMPLLEDQFQMNDTPTVCVPTGIQSLDEHMHGGLPIGEVAMLCAFTGVGKTTFGLNIMWGGANLGWQTRIASLELTGQKCSQRLYSNIADYDYGKILYGDGSGKAENFAKIRAEVNERIKQNAKGRENNIQIWDFSRERCSMQTIKDWLHRDQDRQAAAGLPPPQALYLDWLLMLDEDPGFDPRRLSEKEVRHKIQRHMDEFARLVQDEKIAGWIATQGDQKAEGKSIITVANAAEAKSSGWRVYLFGGLGMSPADRACDPPKAVFHAAKARDLKQFTVDLAANLDVQRFGVYPTVAEKPIEDNFGITRDLAANQAGRLMPQMPQLKSLNATTINSQ